MADEVSAIGVKLTLNAGQFNEGIEAAEANLTNLAAKAEQVRAMGAGTGTTRTTRQVAGPGGAAPVAGQAGVPVTVDAAKLRAQVVAGMKELGPVSIPIDVTKTSVQAIKAKIIEGLGTITVPVTVSAQGGGGRSSARLQAAVVAEQHGTTIDQGEVFVKNAGRKYGVEHRSSGGPVYAGRGYVVGERRPELFVPQVSGKIESRVVPIRSPREMQEQYFRGRRADRYYETERDLPGFDYAANRNRGGRVAHAQYGTWAQQYHTSRGGTGKIRVLPGEEQLAYHGIDIINALLRTSGQNPALSEANRLWYTEQPVVKDFAGRAKALRLQPRQYTDILSILSSGAQYYANKADALDPLKIRSATPGPNITAVDEVTKLLRGKTPGSHFATAEMVEDVRRYMSGVPMNRANFGPKRSEFAEAWYDAMRSVIDRWQGRVTTLGLKGNAPIGLSPDLFRGDIPDLEKALAGAVKASDWTSADAPTDVQRRASVFAIQRVAQELGREPRGIQSESWGEIKRLEMLATKFWRSDKKSGLVVPRQAGGHALPFTPVPFAPGMDLRQWFSEMKDMEPILGLMAAQEKQQHRSRGGWMRYGGSGHTGDGLVKILQNAFPNANISARDFERYVNRTNMLDLLDRAVPLAEDFPLTAQNINQIGIAFRPQTREGLRKLGMQDNKWLGLTSAGFGMKGSRILLRAGAAGDPRISTKLGMGADRGDYATGHMGLGDIFAHEYGHAVDNTHANQFSRFTADQDPISAYGRFSPKENWAEWFSLMTSPYGTGLTPEVMRDIFAEDTTIGKMIRRMSQQKRFRLGGRVARDDILPRAATVKPMDFVGRPSWKYFLGRHMPISDMESGLGPTTTNPWFGPRGDVESYAEEMTFGRFMPKARPMQSGGPVGSSINLVGVKEIAPGVSVAWNQGVPKLLFHGKGLEHKAVTSSWRDWGHVNITHDDQPAKLITNSTVTSGVAALLKQFRAIGSKVPKDWMSDLREEMAEEAARHQYNERFGVHGPEPGFLSGWIDPEMEGWGIHKNSPFYRALAERQHARRIVVSARVQGRPTEAPGSYYGPIPAVPHGAASPRIVYRMPEKERAKLTPEELALYTPEWIAQFEAQQAELSKSQEEFGRWKKLAAQGKATYDWKTATWSMVGGEQTSLEEAAMVAKAQQAMAKATAGPKRYPGRRTQKTRDKQETIARARHALTKKGEAEYWADAEKRELEDKLMARYQPDEPPEEWGWRNWQMYGAGGLGTVGGAPWDEPPLFGGLPPATPKSFLPSAEEVFARNQERAARARRADVIARAEKMGLFTVTRRHRAAGGPVGAYIVNEVGKEGFVTSEDVRRGLVPRYVLNQIPHARDGARTGMIDKPPYSLFLPEREGLVIPAHLVKKVPALRRAGGGPVSDQDRFAATGPLILPGTPTRPLILPGPTFTPAPGGIEPVYRRTRPEPVVAATPPAAPAPPAPPAPPVRRLPTREEQQAARVNEILRRLENARTVSAMGGGGTGAPEEFGGDELHAMLTGVPRGISMGRRLPQSGSEKNAFARTMSWLFGGGETLARAQAEVALATTKYNKALAAQKQPLLDRETDFANLNKMLKAGTIDTETYNTALKRVKDNYKGVTGPLEKQYKDLQDLQKKASGGPGMIIRNLGTIALATTAYGYAMTAVQTAMEAATPAAEKLADQVMGFRSSFTGTTTALATQAQQQGGNVKGVIAATAATAGLSQSTATWVDQALSTTVAVKAGAKAYEQASDLYKAAIGATAAGGKQGVYGGYGGVGGTALLAQQMGGAPGGVEQLLGNVLAARGGADYNLGQYAGAFGAGAAAGGVAALPLTGGSLSIPAALAGGTIAAGGLLANNIINGTMVTPGPVPRMAGNAEMQIVSDFNKALDRANQRYGDVGNRKLTFEGADVSSFLPKGLPQQYLDLAKAGYALTDKRTGQLVTDYETITKTMGRGFTGFSMPDPAEWAKQFNFQFSAAIEAIGVQFQRTMSIAIPYQTTQQLLQQPQIQPGAGFFGQTSTGAFTALGLSPGAMGFAQGALGSAQASQTALAGIGQQGYAAQLQNIMDNLDRPGTGSTRGVGTGLGPNATAYNNLYTAAQKDSQAIAGFTTEMLKFQKTASDTSWSNQIRIATRSWRDALGMAGKAGGSALGIWERATHLLQVQGQTLGFQLQERAIATQLALAKFQAPGETGEERYARQAQAITEAKIARKQLTISENEFDVSKKIWIENANRAATDAAAALGVMKTARDAEGATVAAQIAIAKKEQELGVTMANMDAIVNKANDTWKTKFDIANQYLGTFGTALKDATKDVFEALGYTVKETKGGGLSFTAGTGSLPSAAGTSNAGAKFDFNGPSSQERNNPSGIHATTGAAGPGRPDASGTYGPGQAAGAVGLVKAPTMAMYGEAGTEAVAILRNPKMLNSLGSSGGGAPTNLTVNINGPVVRDERDIQELARCVADEVEKTLSRKGQLLGLRAPAY